MSTEAIIALVAGLFIGALVLYLLISYRNWKTAGNIAPQDLFDRKAVEDLLRKSGFVILRSNIKQPVVTHINDKEHYGQIEADYLVKQGKLKYVVVVKKDKAEFDANEPLLRRKLIECCRAFKVAEVLLVDPDQGEIHKASFHFPHEWNLDSFFRFLLALCLIAGVIGIIWMLVSVKLF